ncbi:hypothetical protein ASG97_00160 [Bacillus sp. Soil745]|nr:hypothetical protein ASG97_00160 [Bacillus sp. Soil745]
MREGNYAFTNDTHISVANEKKNLKQILKHEFVHKETVGMSTFGILLMMMEKASIVDNRKMWLFNELLDIFNKMQERTATFIEYFDIIREEGMEEFNRKVEELKNTNKTYYKYFSFIYEYLKKEEHFLKKESVEEIINKIKDISILSSNVEIDKLPFDEWSEKKDIQRYFSENENILKFNPNKRFEALIKWEFDRRSKYKNQAEKVLENTYLESDTINVCINAIIRIYSDSKGLNIIHERISKFQFNEYDYENIYHLRALTAFPMLYNIDLNCSHERAEVNTTLNKLKKDNKSIMHFNHLLAGFEKFALLSCISDRDSELKVTTSPYNLEEITSIIKKVDNPIVFSQSKIYTRYKDILHQNLNDRQMYIFMENSLLSSYNFLSSEFASSKYVQISQEGYDIIAIRKKNFTLIQLVVQGAGKEVKNALEEINIQPANILETMAIYNEEVKNVASSIFKLCNVAVKNKSYGFK